MEFVSNPALIGQRLKQLRLAKRLTLGAVAQAIKLSPRAVLEWECGHCTPDYWNLIAIAQYFEVSLDYLAGFKAEVSMEPTA